MASVDILRAAHSPLPWQVERSKGSNRVVMVGDSLGDRVVLAGFASAVGSVGDEPSQNTDFIVRACNAHYQMLEALKDISRAIEAKRQIWERDLSADMRDRMLCCNDKHFHRAEEKVRAAIAAAEAEAGR